MGEWITMERAIRDDDILTIAYFQYEPHVPLDSVSWENVVAACNQYVIWRNTILKNYAGLFEKREEKDDDAIYNNLNLDRDKEDLEADQALNEYNERYSWYDTLFVVFAKENYLNMKDCYKLKVIEVLNHLSFLQSKRNLT
jgi:hypothetical protein